MLKTGKFSKNKLPTTSTDTLSMLWLLHIATAIVILVQELLNPALIPNHWVIAGLICTVGIIPFSFVSPKVFRMLTIFAAVMASLGILYGFSKLLLTQTSHTTESHYTIYVLLLSLTPLSFFTVITSLNRTKQRLIVTGIYYGILLLICGYFLMGNGPRHADSFLQTTLSIFISSLTALIIIFMGSLLMIKSKNDTRIRALREQSFKDTVTQLANRTAFHERLNEICTALTTANSKKLFGLILVDIDGFKAINDHYGTTTGDTCLKIIAQRIDTFVSNEASLNYENCLVARTDGDEFTLLFPIHDPTLLSKFCQNLKEVLTERISIDDLRIQVPVAISACEFPKDAREPHLLVQRLDWAMQEAKQHKDYFVYNHSLGERIAHTEELKSELAKAIEKEELFLHYQPLLNLHTDQVESAEVLLRWKNARLGNVSPAEFIPIAEQSGLILSIGQWVLEASCQQLQKWLDKGLNIRLAVNISVAQFQSEDFIDNLERCVSDYEIDKSKLELEITESLAFDKIAFDRLSQLQELGYTVKLDDFGTGYSSLSVMSNLPLNCLKIDRSFIQYLDVQSDIKKWMMVKTIVDLAQNFQLDVIAEGVETQEQLIKLKELGCDYVQGFYLSRPIGSEEFEQTFLGDQIEKIIQPILATQSTHLESVIN